MASSFGSGKSYGNHPGPGPLPDQQQLELIMDKDRIEGSANQAKGAIKQAAGKLTGDAKLQAEGAADKAKGQVQNAVGGVKDALRDAAKH
jgi:uncharacterized protein YjbJ (UPF0337 family)